MTPGPDIWRPSAYLALLAVHTAAAGALLAVVFPLFQQIVSRSGEPQPLETSTAVMALAATLAMQGCYWTRYRHMPVAALRGGAVAGHVVMFAGRVSFFFGGALFSAIFFRHAPQLDALPPPGQAIAKTLGVMTLLFALFCYALELERFGRAIEERAHKAS